MLEYSIWKSSEHTCWMILQPLGLLTFPEKYEGCESLLHQAISINFMPHCWGGVCIRFLPCTFHWGLMAFQQLERPKRSTRGTGDWDETVWITSDCDYVQSLWYTTRPEKIRWHPEKSRDSQNKLVETTTFVGPRECDRRLPAKSDGDEIWETLSCRGAILAD